MATLTISANSSTSNSVTTNNTRTDLDTVGTGATLMLVNYGSQAVRVHFSANNDLELEDTVTVDYSGQDSRHGRAGQERIETERGVVVEGGTTSRCIIVPAVVDTTAANNTVTINCETLHAPAFATIDLGVCLEGTILQANNI